MVATFKKGTLINFVWKNPLPAPEFEPTTFLLAVICFSQIALLLLAAASPIVRGHQAFLLRCIEYMVQFGSTMSK